MAVNNSAIAAEEFSRALEPHLHLPAPATAVAVSGGVDSMALLLLLKEKNIPLQALTVDHGLRSESATEATQVAAWCKTLGIPHTTLHWQHEKITSGVPEKARDARYELMFDWCRTNHIQHLFTAHHLDDQIETVLFRLTRGSGLVGLSGIMPITSREGIFLHRPLLSFPKSRLIATLEKAKQPWLEDPSNQNTAFTRNAMRTQLHTLSPEQKQRLHAITQSFTRFRNGLEKQVEQALSECFSGELLQHEAFIKQPEELKIRILHHICNNVSGDGEPVRSEKIARLLASIETGKGKHMLHGVLFDYRPKCDGWQVKPLAETHDLAQNKALKQRKNNAQ